MYFVLFLGSIDRPTFLQNIFFILFFFSSFDVSLLHVDNSRVFLVAYTSVLSVAALNFKYRFCVAKSFAVILLF